MPIRTTLTALACFCIGALVGIALPKLFGESIKVHITHEIKLTPKVKQ